MRIDSRTLLRAIARATPADTRLERRQRSVAIAAFAIARAAAPAGPTAEPSPPAFVGPPRPER